MLDDKYAALHFGVEPGEYVVLTVSDTGIGMDEATRSQIFEPFFTTKGDGTGLGLSTVFGIVKQSGGNIWVYSEPGHGTTFRVYLPRSSGAVAPVRPSREPAFASHGWETVLVVEDEDAVPDLATRVLDERGHAVLEAGTPNEALALCARHDGQIDLLITDMVLPGMSGRDLAARLREQRPGISVLYMSGYTLDSMLHQGLLEAGAAFLPKPFTPAQLMETASRLLSAG